MMAELRIEPPVEQKGLPQRRQPPAQIFHGIAVQLASDPQVVQGQVRRTAYQRPTRLLRTLPPKTPREVVCGFPRPDLPACLTSRHTLGPPAPQVGGGQGV